jgi:hypothetical protein
MGVFMRLSTFGTVVAASVVLGAAGTADATSVFSPGPDPFPNGAMLVLTTPTAICPTPTLCVDIAAIKNLQFVSATSIPGGFDEQLSASLYARLVNRITGVPIGASTLALVPGTYFDVSITGGYNPFTNPIGSFPETINALAFAGTSVLGNAITASLAAAPPSTGTVTIRSALGGFMITNVLTVYANAAINGLPFSVPPLTATLAPAPEAATWVMMLLGFGGVGTLMRSRRRAAAKGA